MASTSLSVRIGASRLLAKFLLVLTPVFLLSAALGLWLVADRMAQSAHDGLSARIGTQAGHIAGALGRLDSVARNSASQDLLSTLLYDPAILCAEVKTRSGEQKVLLAPEGLGCKGLPESEQFQIPVGTGGDAVLYVRYGTGEVEATRQNYRDFALLALLIGLIISAAASLVSFHLIIGKPLNALQTAMLRTEESGEPVYVSNAPADELGSLIRAYNQMQANLAEQTEHALRKSAELNSQRQRNEALLSKVFQVGPYPFAIIDPGDGTYYNVNEVWLSVMGYRRQDVIGRTAHELGIWVDADEREVFVSRLMDVGSVRSFEAKVRTKEGRILDTLMSGEFVEIDGDGRLFMVADDVTEIKRAEAERQRHHEEIFNAKLALESTNEKLVQRTRELVSAQETLVQQERLATLGELTATVSHELRNPLSAIRSSVHLALQKTKDLEIGVDRSLERAERNIKRCDGIISDLLGYASEPQSEDEVIEGDRWLKATLSELTVPDGIKVEPEFSTPKTTLKVNPERMRQAVVNIFENAVQALENVPDRRLGRLKIRTSLQAGCYTVAFEDNGPGLDADRVEKVFEPLFSTKSYGCGLGLATTKKIIEKYNGQIDFVSEVGAGTTVTVRVPAMDVQERAA